MLLFGPIRQHKFWSTCALATIFLITWFYLLGGQETQPAWNHRRPAVLSPSWSDKADLTPPSADKIDATHITPSSDNTTYTQTLVIAKLQEEDTSWVKGVVDELPHLTSATYTVDSSNATLTVLKNKGHEAMVYLTYIIDHYSRLSDITLFMHSHQITWHNNDFLNSDSALTIKRLRSDYVIRNGYVNLRCHLNPGCPNHIHPTADVETEDITNIPEAAVIGVSWTQLFPQIPVPAVLSQPCCSQFAVSAERIRKIPLDDYVFYRDWLLRTTLEDRVSGRIWEYIWQWLYTGQAEYCPKETVCYCEGYGICFEQEQYDEYFRLRDAAKELQKEVDDLTDPGGKEKDVSEEKISSMKARIKGMNDKMDEIKASTKTA